jgi:predicted component of type VI protein secretion system
LARRINGDEIEITLFDISAQEMAADLATGADLSKTGIFGLLNAPLAELGDTGFSAVFGLYGFEETPPHAELLGRIGQIAAHLRAPFFAAISPKYLEVARNDRHPLVARAWDALAAEPGAGWLSLLSPRFLMRRPYGKRTEPIDAFDFEEFTLAEGLHGMLWGNPAVLMAVLLSLDWEEDGARMRPGKRLTVNDLPFHYVTDPHGDQVALPCTERLITLDKSTETVARGLIPVLAVKGRDEVRLGSVQSLAGQMVQGRWTDAPPPPEEQKTSYGGVPKPTFSLPAGYEIEPEPAAPAPKPATAATAGPTAAPAAALDDLDALLAGFGDTAAPINPESIDADLAALLEGL